MTTLEEISLPRNTISRLAKAQCPVGIQKDALLALQKSSVVFLNYIASTANDITHRDGRKIITPQDMLAAIEQAEFESFVPELRTELESFKFSIAQKKERKKDAQLSADSNTIKKIKLNVGAMQSLPEAEDEVELPEEDDRLIEDRDATEDAKAVEMHSVADELDVGDDQQIRHHDELDIGSENDDNQDESD